MLAQLERINAEGVAFDREEHTLGIRAVGGAVDTPTGPVAHSVPVPGARFHGDEQRVVEPLEALSRTLSSK